MNKFLYLFEFLRFFSIKISIEFLRYSVKTIVNTTKMKFENKING